jgi:hypothetical protein
VLARKQQLLLRLLLHSLRRKQLKRSKPWLKFHVKLDKYLWRLQLNRQKMTTTWNRRYGKLHVLRLHHSVQKFKLLLSVRCLFLWAV